MRCEYSVVNVYGAIQHKVWSDRREDRLAIRTVLVGCGAMSKGWLKAVSETPELAKKIDIVGFLDLDKNRAEALATEFDLSGAVIGADLDDLLSQTKPDAVFDVVVPEARLDVVTTALRHGCHVLSEKPMATSLDDASEMISGAETAGKTHAIIQNRRYVDGAQRVRKFLASGKLGTLTGLHCDFFLGPHFGGFREEMAHVLLLDMAIHTFDAARFMSGEEPVAVYCHESNPRDSWYQAGAAANAIFELTNDVSFTYRGSWCAEGMQTSWEASWRFIGTKGTLLWDGHDKLVAECVGRDRTEDDFFSPVTEVAIPPLDEDVISGHAGVIDDFVRSLETGAPPLTVNTDNIKSLAMVLGAIESAKTGQRIRLEH